MESSCSLDSSVWNLIKSRCPPPEVDEARIKIGRTLLQENQSLHEERAALQSILYELYGDRLKKPLKLASSTQLTPQPPSGIKESGGSKRMFRDALLYSKLHYESTEAGEGDGKVLSSPSKLKQVKTSNTSSLTSVKSNKLNSITNLSTFDEIFTIISSVSFYNLSIIEANQSSLLLAVTIENKKLTDLCEYYRKIIENGIDDLSEDGRCDYSEPVVNNNNNSRGNSSNSKTRDRFKGLKEDIYFLDD